MNRGYSYEEYMKKIELLRSRIPDIAITTDIIVGFPGETDEDYLDTVKALKEIGFDGIFAFKYSKRKGTKAYEMSGQIPDHIKSERLAFILSLQEEITYKKNKELEGSVQEVLIEGPSETDIHMLSGRTRTNKIVTIQHSPEITGSLISVRIQKARRPLAERNKFSLRNCINLIIMKVSVLTLGCRVNQSESSVIEGTLKENGITIVDLKENPDMCIVNTCTVTAKSDYNSRQLIRKAAKAGAKVIVTGCYSHLRNDEVRSLPGVIELVDNTRKYEIVNFITGKEN